MGMAFFRNMFGEAHVAVARCQLGGSSSGVCQLEFHEYGMKKEDNKDEDSNGRRRLQQQGKEVPQPLDGPSEKEPGTLKMAFPVPRGIGGLTYDAAVYSEFPQYFLAPFVGMTSMNKDKQSKSRGDPEDRVMMFRAPILQTGYRKSEDSISLRIFGNSIFDDSLENLLKGGDETEGRSSKKRDKIGGEGGKKNKDKELGGKGNRDEDEEPSPRWGVLVTSHRRLHWRPRPPDFF